MVKIFFLYLIIAASFFSAIDLKSQNYSVEDFVGTWYGTIESGGTFKYLDNITLTLNSDGTYYENSGHLMPTLYPNTQTWNIDYENSRLHFQYLSIVYAGMRTYQHFYYDIVDFKSDMFELHYNFWNDLEPHPDVQKLVLSKSPTNIEDTDFSNLKVLVKVINLYGIELPIETKGVPALYIYHDGKIEKKLVQD